MAQPWFNASDQFERLRRRVVFMRRQPSWVAGSALIAAVLVVVIPLLLLTLAAVLVGGVVFALLSLAARVTDFLRGPGRSGRRNVTVIRSWP